MMVSLGTHLRRAVAGLAILFGLACQPAGLRAEMQFDLFPGYGGAIKEANWFPVTCEIHNDGSGFNAVIEIGQQGREKEAKRVHLELPADTRKRFTIPFFASSHRINLYGRLSDEGGDEIAERSLPQIQCFDRQGTLMGALPRQFSTAPQFPKPSNRGGSPHSVARMIADHVPGNPIAYEGLDAVYLNSEKAVELESQQVEGLLGWLHGGGHLIVGLESPLDLNSVGWLNQVAPVWADGVKTFSLNDRLYHWIRGTGGGSSGPSGSETNQGRLIGASPTASFSPGNSLYRRMPADPAFREAEVSLVEARLRPEGRLILGEEESPLIAGVTRGRGQVTMILFSPEREPFKSWENQGLFWARLLEIPDDQLRESSNRHYGNNSLDGVFGAMIDSRQVSKLPVKWLLLILAGYLLVIGPFDQYWLKKINKQVLTWITFPAYVVFFSVLIWYIGYKLKAGETEWNELQVVDVLPRHGEAALRGRTFGSLYSPANKTYELRSNQPHATLRNEFFGLWESGMENSRTAVLQRDEGFRAEVYVPVWTSRLFVSDWIENADPPLEAERLEGRGAEALRIVNRLGHSLKSVRVAYEDRIHDLGDLDSGQANDIELRPNSGMRLRDFVRREAGRFRNAVQARRRTVGDTRAGRLNDPEDQTMAATFISQYEGGNRSNREFLFPQGMDLSGLVDRGYAVILAWSDESAPAKALNEFNPKRQSHRALYRLAVDMTGDQ